MKKKFFYLIFFIIFQMPLIIFADDDNSYEITANILNSVLDIVAWLGYAIALGILIWIGIKYMLSGANERAKLKGTATMYLIGVALIVLCSTIASGVAELANKDGKNTAEGIVDKGLAFYKNNVTYKSEKEEHADKITTVHPTSEAPYFDDIIAEIKDRYMTSYYKAATKEIENDNIIYRDKNGVIVGKDVYKYKDGKIKSIEHQTPSGKTISKDVFKYSENNSISSVTITNEINGKRESMITVNYRTNEKTVAAIIRHDVIDNPFYKEDEYIVTEMEIFDDNSYETLKE